MKKVNIKTKAYGDYEINESEILNFPNGILAFEEYTSYAVITGGDDNPFHWLQSLDNENIAFLIMEPTDLVPSYQPELIKHEVVSVFKEENSEALSLWCILTIPQGHPEKMTINMQGPLLISKTKKLGGQFISNDDSHQVRMPVLELAETGEIIA